MENGNKDFDVMWGAGQFFVIGVTLISGLTYAFMKLPAVHAVGTATAIFVAGIALYKAFYDPSDKKFIDG